MTPLNRITIKTRMTLSFVLILVLFVLFGFISMRQMGTLGNLTATLYDHPLQVSNAALKAKVGVISMHRSMKDVSTSKTRLAVTLAIQQVTSLEKDVYRELEIIQHLILGEEGKRLVKETVDMFAGWKPIRVEVEELVLQGKQEAANRITREKGAQYVARLERQMAALTSYAINKADGFMAEAEQVESAIVRNTTLFITAVLLVSLLIGYLVSSSILTSITALKDTMTRITRTGELSDAVLAGKNEITEMAGHFNGLIQRLRQQFWLGDGQNLLNRELSGDLEYEELLEKSIREICRYTDACAGALYTYDRDEKTCSLQASFALVERKFLGSRFKLGEGIVGQVAVEKKPILLTGVSRDEAMGRSGTVSQPPAALLAVPLLYEKALYGVLEIAVFDDLSPIKQEFLSHGANIITTYLHTAAQNRRIKELLEESQVANEQLKTQTVELQAQTEELQTLNEEFQEQSRELKEQNMELEAQRRQVEEANRLKSEFLSNMSHELRTPLNSVNALSRVLILQTKGKLTEEELGYLEIIERNGKHLLSLINDILDLSKIEAGRMDVTLGRFSVASVLDAIVESVSPLAEEKGITLEQEIPDTLSPIESDESRVLQILQNIIANAVKFTDHGGVTIRVDEAGAQIQIRVEDTGIGMSQSDLADIFEEFRQVDGATTRRYEGTGLGLAIAYKAARMLGGDIRVESEKDRGSVFTVTLPKQFQGPRPAAPPGPGSGSVPGSKKSSGLEPPLPSGDRNGRTVLVVDDDPRVLSMIARAFRREGYETLTASTGRDAVRLARTHQPFAVTLDVIMPDMDGWEVLSKLKNDPKTADIPVIIVSVSNDRDTGFALGAVGYVTKPVSRDVLVKEINKIYGHLPASVMVVDDNELDRNQAARMIRDEGMEVVTAENGTQCLELLDRESPDVLVLDLVMPGMDGFQVLEKLRKSPAFQELPVIIVTAKDLSYREKQALEQHAAAILIKGETSAAAILEEIKEILDSLGKPPPPPKPVPKRNRILLVEDNDAAVIQVKTALETLGLEVDVAQDGRQALAHMEGALPGGIVLDLMMPGMDGFELLESIRSTGETREIPVLILTAKDLTPEDLDRLSANNVHQLIQKGDVDREGLLKAVARMLGRPVLEPGAMAGPVRPAAEKPGPVPSRPPARPGPERDIPLVLVVEDNPDNMTTIRAVLGNRLQVSGAADGETGLEMASELLPDLILLDMSLPGMDGFEAVKRLKANEATAAVPVIALTAQAMKGDRERIIAAGCDDYIAKPIDPETIMDTIVKWT